MRLLRDRSSDLQAAGIRPFAISLDHRFSQKAWAESLSIENVQFLSDRLGETAEGFGVMSEYVGMPMSDRAAFLISGDTVTASWYLGREMPDIDAIVASASSS